MNNDTTHGILFNNPGIFYLTTNAKKIISYSNEILI